MSLTLETLPIDAEVALGEGYAATVCGTWSAPPGEPVFLQASDDAGNFRASPALPAPKTSVYRLPVVALSDRTAGEYAGTLTVRACADALCAQPYQGASRSVAYRLRISQLAHWETLQRNSRHDGFVPISIDSTKLRKAWQWTDPFGRAVGAVVTSAGRVYVSEPAGGDSGASGSVIALAASDGTAIWRRWFPATATVNPVTFNSGVLYGSTSAGYLAVGSIWALRAADGALLFEKPMADSRPVSAPAVEGGRASFAAGGDGYYQRLSAVSALDGVQHWSVPGKAPHTSGPAMADGRIYISDGSMLSVFDAATGSLVRSVGAPETDGHLGYYGAPMLGASDHVVSFGGLRRSYPGAAQPLVNYSVDAGAIRWRTTRRYSTYPARANGVVYAGATSEGTGQFPDALDAIDEATGRLMWSVQVPWPTDNVVATRNLVFVSTPVYVFAIDTTKRRVVWRGGPPGTLAISGDRLLLVVSPPNSRPGKVTAYRFD